MDSVPHMDIGEFVAEGYYQEANRRFFHPLGLALEVTAERCPCDEGTVERGPSGATYTVTCPDCSGMQTRHRISGVWDYRDDPEGIYFDGEAEPEKTRRINEEWARRRANRERGLGFMVEPVSGTLTLNAGDAESHRPVFLDWLREHDLDPNVVYRVEIAGATMTVYRFRTNAAGKKFIEDGDVAVEEPLTVTLTSPCPVL